MEVNKQEFDRFLAVIEKKEVTASFDCDGWITLNRTCKEQTRIKCGQDCAKFQTTHSKAFNTIQIYCYASGQPVELCEISLEKENEDNEKLHNH
jgi:hypothetical protein